MKNPFFNIVFAALAVVITLLSCEKPADDDNNNNNNNATVMWNINVNVDLGGTFPVVATANITTTGATFSAAITTCQIGGAAEVHNATIAGAANGNTLTVTNAQFNIIMGNDTESVTINTATITIDGSNMAGNGTITVIPAGSSTPQNGTFTLTGSKA